MATGRFQVLNYVARQSWVSALSDPTTQPQQEIQLKSKFQQRMVEADLASSALREIFDNAEDAEILLLDLVDERVGLVPTETGYVTNSYELRNSGWNNEIATGDTIDFGTDEHFELWVNAADRLRNWLDESGLLERSVVIRTQYAERSAQGDLLEEKMRRSPREWNELFSRYYDHLLRINMPIVSADPALMLADRQHAWGLEAFHYVDKYYTYLADCIENRT
ncbi:DUF6270 domain-containing protein [Gulosibacter sp. ACHW.36C]|uniref:DUF6270 domain-containing protein n=1 Tax=Gulosibacter sediminis TaxID=1729695 RepID=A0ABY4MXD6_9MICO|nr:DUF6270 domain-containing protein [Gulosibacter sediminis]UQN15092.1 DUF6270 domain-containing protein [Gulosibacter sediminis]